MPKEIDSGDERTPAQLRRLAKERGCEMVEPADDELLIDLDGKHEMHKRLYALIEEHFGVLKKQRWTSASGEGSHYRLTVNRRDLSPVERLLLQALLGSDPVREFFSLLRIRRGHECPSVLFRPKAAPEPRCLNCGKPKSWYQHDAPDDHCYASGCDEDHHEFKPPTTHSDLDDLSIL